MTGIYKIESKIHPDRIYIGSSSGIYRRWENQRIKRSINQQGIKNNFYGKHHTDESRQKIKESWIKRKLKIAS